MRFKKFLLAKAFFVLVLLCLFLQARAGSIEFDLEIEDNDISLQSNGGYTRVFLKDGISIKDSPGFPELPTRYIRLVIPTGSIPTGVEVEVEEEVFANNLFIYPIQPPHPTDTDMDEALHFDPLAYSILDYYPQESAVLQGTEHLHGFTLAVVRLNVLRYKEDTSQLLYARRIQGKLLFSEVESPPSYLRQTSNPLLQAPIQSQYSDEVARLIVNPQDLVVIPSLKRSGMLDWETENEIQYIIITNEILCDAFQELADYRISKGTSATVITMDWIRSHYEGTRPDGGEDDPTRIRNCIRDYYLNYGTRWAVLGGDDVPVPVRYCSKPWVDIPCDLYYGCLDGTWDADGDGIYGEIEDEVDFASEVWIGRIPVQTSEQALAYIAKVRTYENRSPDGFANTMLLQAHCGANDKLKTGLDRPLDFQDHDPVDPWEMSTRQLYQMDNWGIQNFWQASRLSYFFETYTSWDRVYCGDYDYGYMSCNVLEKLNWGYHYIFSSSHGNTNYYTSVNTLIADQMTNADRPSIFLISSCSTAHFDQCEVCLSEALLRNPKGGAVIYIGYTRPGWLRPDDARCLFSELYENNRQTIGEAFSVSRAYYATVNTIDDGYRDLLFMVNLHGDPGLRVLRGENGRHVQMMSPKGCEVIDENADIWIRWNACGADYMSDETVRLDYSADAGNTWQAVPGAENLPYNSRWFLWEEPMLAPGSDYRIRVMANTDPSISDTSESNFTIGTMYTLRVMSTPKQNIWVTGSHYNFTDYTYRVLEGRPVSFRAGALTGYNFVRWADANKNTITRNMAIHFIMTGNKTITAEYESAGSLRDYYVNDEIAEDGFSPGSNENDGFSPSSPVRNIQEILDRYSDIKTLYVSAGTYKENLVIGSGDPNIVLQGYGRDSTILDGQEREPCLNIQNTSHIAIQGFTIQNGYHSNGNGGGIALDNAKSIRILRNRICNNVSGYHGGGVCIDHVSGIAEVAENEIYGNSGTAVGGGVSFLNCSDVGLRDNSIYGNTSKICGGIWFFVIGKIEVANNVIRDNQSNENGGGLFLQSASGIIQINEIINNSALGSGGGIFCVDTDKLLLFNNLISENSANKDGGGISLTSSEFVQIMQNRFYNNSSFRGGGVWIYEVSGVEFDENDIRGNVGTAAGGGISFLFCDKTEVYDNIIYLNNSTNGGGLFLQSASGIIQINEIINNSALGSGGGIFCADSDQLLLFSNLIAGNSANSNGGGILNRKNGQMILTNCTIGNNTATNGGGIYNSATDLTINNSILWGNTDTQNKQILDAFASPSSIEVSFSDVQGGFSGNNIDADPLFTDPNNNDYRVSSESPCIDAGDNTAVLPDFLLDLDGKNRIVNGDCQNQDSVDMGAYEFDWTAFGDFAGGCNVNLEDFMLFASVWLSKEGDLYYNPLYDIYNPNDHVINGFDLGILIDNWLEGN